MAAYEEVACCSVGGVRVQKLRSLRTGLRVCLAAVDGPLVNGYFCLATEAHDHDGLPHTLEHLVFMGSEQFPYKGVLDLLANRCLAAGTNAWTDVDHTCYTVTTAGGEGFLRLLPVYLDHILYPTLTDSAYLTEVHHVSGEGQDVGVVYCEMQATENTGQSRTHFQLMQDMYPGRCGYKSETGGRLENLRTSCSNAKVRSYHRSFYRHDNLCLIVTGRVSAEQLFEALAPVETNILSKSALPELQRPWQTPVPALVGGARTEVPFPSDLEEVGMLRVAWRGPQAQDRGSFVAVCVLLEYLCDSAVAPLQRALVEAEPPFCADVRQLLVENVATCVGVTLHGVPCSQISTAEDKVMEVLSGLAEGGEALDMPRLDSLIRRNILRIQNQVEETPHYFFAFALIGEFLFAQHPNEFSSYLDQLPYFEQLLTEPESFWVAMVAKYFVQAPRVSVVGVPSRELSVRMLAEEAGRVEQQWAALGEEGRREKADALATAVKENEVEAPGELVASLPVPSTDSIHFHPLVVVGNHQPAGESALPELVRFPVQDIPFFFQFHHVQSAFVELTAVLDTAALSQTQRLLLPLIPELIFESPVLRGGEVVPYEQVVKELAADTVAMAASLGHLGSRFNCGAYAQAVFVSVKVESARYTRGVSWLKEVLAHLVFSAERITVVATKMMNSLTEMKRKGRLVVNSLARAQLFTDNSNKLVADMATQASFLSSLLLCLTGHAPSPDDSRGGHAHFSSTSELLQQMTSLRDLLLLPSNLRVFMAADGARLQASDVQPWKDFLPHPPTSFPSMVAVLPASTFVKSCVGGVAQVAGVGGVESSFLTQSVACVTSQSHPDYPALLVLIEYLCALEGPMWRQIRGMGLAYHYSMSCLPETGRLTLRLFKSAQLLQAHSVAQAIIAGFVSGATAFTAEQLEAAISGTVYNIVKREKTIADAADQAILNHLCGTAQTHHKWLLGAVSRVVLDDLRRVAGQYCGALLEPACCVTSVCCSPGKAAEVKAGLESLGLAVQLVENLDSLAVC